MPKLEHQTQHRETTAAARGADRRDELADAALDTLAQLGYARTTLREIAAHSPYSHGVVHYYFDDKIDLILHGVRRYKRRCAIRYDDVVARSATPEDLIEGFASTMVASLLDEAHLHRLWYDLRSQSYFDERLRDDVLEIDGLLQAMIWRVVSRYLDLLGTTSSVSPATAYGTFDGLFQHALLRHLITPDVEHRSLRADVADAMARLAG